MARTHVKNRHMVTLWWGYTESYLCEHFNIYLFILVLTVPATDIAEETVISEEPPSKRQCIEIIENRVDSGEIEVFYLSDTHT